MREQDKIQGIGHAWVLKVADIASGSRFHGLECDIFRGSSLYKIDDLASP